MRSLFVSIYKQLGSKNLLFKLISILFILFFFSLSSNAAVYQVFVSAKKASAPDVYPDIFVKSSTKTDFSYDYELYQLSFDMSAGDYLGFSLGFDNYTNSPSYVLFDKVELDGPSGAIALSNSGFEAGTTGWSTSCPPWAISTFTISTDAYEGSNAAKLTVENASHDGFCAIRNSTNIPIVETGSYTLSVYAKVHETEFPPDEILAMEVGNQWIYDSNGKNRVTKFDQSTFRKDTYEVEALVNDISLRKEWYEPFKGEMRYWGFQDEDGLFGFEKGLLVTWFPATVGERREYSTGVVGYIGTITMTVDVMALEQLTLGFGTLDAYKFRYILTVASPGGTGTETHYWWVVPYLGIVKMQYGGASEQLTSFIIGGGTITQDTDTDGDGLKDYEEMSIYNTDRLDSDTDDDGLSDGEEVNTYETDPIDNDSDDDGNAASDWPGAFSFKTITTDESDQNQNGIPDDQEIDDPNLDLDNDGNPDINQGDMKCVNTAGGAAQIGVKEGTNVTSIECLMWTDPDAIDDTQNKPDDIPLGLVSFKVLVDNEGDTAEVTVYLSEPAPAGARWYKYDAINGWVEYSAHAVFSADRTSVTLQFMDGGFGDADGVANAIIIDPSGFGVAVDGGGGGGGGGCLISTATYGFHMPKGSLALVILFGFFLIGLSEFRKKFKK
jgi:hypothetical protein